jgi:hypothetical protein
MLWCGRSVRTTSPIVRYVALSRHVPSMRPIAIAISTSTSTTATSTTRPPPHRRQHYSAPAAPPVHPHNHDHHPHPHPVRPQEEVHGPRHSTSATTKYNLVRLPCAVCVVQRVGSLTYRRMGLARHGRRVAAAQASQPPPAALARSSLTTRPRLPLDTRRDPARVCQAMVEVLSGGDAELSRRLVAEVLRVLKRSHGTSHEWTTGGRGRAGAGVVMMVLVLAMLALSNAVWCIVSIALVFCWCDALACRRAVRPINTHSTHRSGSFQQDAARRCVAPAVFGGASARQCAHGDCDGGGPGRLRTFGAGTDVAALSPAAVPVFVVGDALTF